MNWLKSVLAIRGAAILIIILVIVWFIHNSMEARKRNEERIEKKVHKQEFAQQNPDIQTDASKTRAATVLQSGDGVDYRAASTPAPSVVMENAPEQQPEQKVEDLPPMVLCDFPVPTPTPVPSPTPPPKAKRIHRWLPRGVFIRCMLQNSLQSSHMDTPVQGKVLEDVYQQDYGRSELIIHAGDRVSSFTSQGYTRDRIEVKGTWSLLFIHDGTEVEFTGIACASEFDPKLNQYGKWDKSAGIPGEVVESDAFVRLKAAVGLLFKTVTDSAQTFASSALATTSRGGTAVSYNVPTASPFTDVLIEELMNGHHTQINDTLYVEVKPKEFYVFTTSIIDPDLASPGAEIQEKEKALKEKEDQQRVAQNPLDMGNVRHLIQQESQPQPSETPSESEPNPTSHFN